MAIGHHVEVLKAYNFICWRGREDRGTSPFQIFSKLVHSRDIAIFRFSRWPVPQSWIFEIVKFYWLTGSRGSRHNQHAKYRQNLSIGWKNIKIFQFYKMAAGAILHLQICEISLADSVSKAQTHQVSSKLVVPLQRYCNFAKFQDGRRRHLGFWNRTILLAVVVERVETHKHAKFCQNRSISCEDIKIFQFFKIAATAILECQIRKILFAGGLLRAQTHYCTKFRQNWSFRCRYIAIFPICKMAAASILDFWNRKILLVIMVERVETHQRAEFCQNRSIGSEDLIFFDFSKWRPSAILDSFGEFLDHPQWVGPYLGVSITLQNLVMIDAVGFIIWTFQYLTRLAGKCLFTPPNLGFWGNLIP